jgi:hypothetical protein
LSGRRRSRRLLVRGGGGQNRARGDVGRISETSSAVS